MQAEINYKTSLSVDGMDCASCIDPLESAISALPGVKLVSANLSGERVEVTFDPGQTSIAEVVATIKGAGHEVRSQLAKFMLEGMSCATCVGRIEEAILNQPGIVSAQVNFANALAYVAYMPGLTSSDEIISAIEKAGYGAVPLLSDVEARQARSKGVPISLATVMVRDA